MPIINSAPPVGEFKDPSGNPLRMAASWLAHKRISRKTEQKTTDLVATLLSHGARAWRMSQPQTQIRLKSYRPDGFSAVRIKFG